MADILNRHHINLHAAKIATLGERAEDTFLISGKLDQSSKRIQLESDLLEAVQV